VIQIRPIAPWTATSRVLASTVVGMLIGFAVGLSTRALVGMLAGIATGAALFVIAGWLVLWPQDADATRHHARREDLRPGLDELVVVAAALGGLVAVIALLVVGHSHDNKIAAAIGIAAVVMSWAGLHLMYSAKYAYLYYNGDETGGINFNNPDEAPAFRDFMYFSYNLGMTYQVSDTSVTNSEIRAVTLRHCMMSYMFGTAILATTINLVVGIVSG